MRVDENGHVVVLVDEEYGYRYHYWRTGMTALELEKFWGSLKSVSVHYFSPHKTLPGKWITCSAEDDEWQWREMEKTGEYYTAHVHWDDDSSLRNPNGQRIFHAGYTGPRSW